MNEDAKNWPFDAEVASWDPYEVWRQRILLPRMQDQYRESETRSWHEHAREAGRPDGPRRTPGK